ncbi:peptidase M13 [Sphingomonas sp. Leaf412]|uniref:M13 family metallopeptidase n=1 Tax=Sphingomonas sp. Leaf412 TaxID=1736370 RepID=UPI0007022C8C|nr:M13-type metalloendopeptidase [Sphingomonas sp. Leaf412]KQT32672.1 peptidase M13 [Sphingomonas sp. Leaf412]
MRRRVILFPLLLSTAAIASAQTAPEKAEQTREVAKAAAGPVKPANPDAPQIGTFGFDMAGRDTNVPPGKDFYDYANGTWDRTTQIPADRSSYGMFHVLRDLSQTRTREILDEATRKPGNKSGDMYASFMDVAAANAKGVAPVKPWLAAIAAAPDRTALAVEAAKLQRLGVGGPFRVGIGQDDKNPDQYIAGISQGGIGLPDRDYYLKDGDAFAGYRTAYQAYLAKLLTMAGETDAEARAAAVMNFEKQLATAHWTRIESRDADKTYNKLTWAQIEAQAPGFPWKPYAAALGIDAQPAVLVAQPTALTGEAKVYAATPLPVLKDQLMLRTLRAYSPYLTDAFDGATFGFYGTTLSGTPEQQARWKRGVDLVSGALGEDVGQAYVARYFPPEAKAQADLLVKNVTAAMGERLKKLAWMAPETKQKALVKLAAFTPKIGYPTKWRDYSALAVKRDDLVGNVARSNEFDYARDLAKLGKPIDRDEWFMSPMTVNAYANPTMNEIVFPAAILQPPFFDPKADPAVNYGGIGAVIGHEISHHFDDQGRKYDPTGKLADWWTPQDVARFDTFTKQLVAQYDAYEPLPGQHIQGGLTLGENIADLAGLTVAIDAYHASLKGKKPAVIDGTTGDQRFYYGWAQVWRTKFREPALRQQLVSDPHSPGHYRALTVRNLDPWYAAFGAKPGDATYLAPTARIRIW